MRTFRVVDDKKHQVTAKSFETFAAADKAMQMLGGDGLFIVDDAGSRFVWNEERGQFDLTVGAAALAELLDVSPSDVECESAPKNAPSTARWINSLARRSASGPHAD